MAERAGFCAVLALAFSAHIALAAEPLLPPLVLDAQHLDSHWRNLGLPGTSKPLTEFSPVLIDGKLAVRVATHHSYSNLAYQLPKPTVMHGLQWSWRVDQPNTKSDLRTKSGDDIALRVCLSFDEPLDKVPFVERQLQRVANAKLGESLPNATLCYVWDHLLPRDTLLDNAFTRRLRFIVLRSTQDGLAQWKTERRDVAADFRRAFGDELAELPAVTAVFIGADSDNTHTDTVSFVAALQAEP